VGDDGWLARRTKRSGLAGRDEVMIRWRYESRSRTRASISQGEDKDYAFIHGDGTKMFKVEE